MSTLVKKKESEYFLHLVLSRQLREAIKIIKKRLALQPTFNFYLKDLEGIVFSQEEVGLLLDNEKKILSSLNSYEKMLDDCKDIIKDYEKTIK